MQKWNKMALCDRNEEPTVYGNIMCPVLVLTAATTCNGIADNLCLHTAHVVIPMQRCVSCLFYWNVLMISFIFNGHIQSSWTKAS